MRLRKLKLRNIASLRGEHLLDFEEIQRQSSLFGITGETGAGKSTILNCVGLALYGQVFKKSLVQNDLVTLGEKEGQIELIFQVKGKTYLAFWKARIRKQNGEYYSTPQSPVRDLYELDGDDFSSPKTITLETTTRLLNLDFDQFTKCVILNQGEFAKFLTSNFSERKDILEKLYPGEVLENLSRELKAELDVCQKQKSELDIELSTLQGDPGSGVDFREKKSTLEAEKIQSESWLTLLESLHYQFTSLSSYRSRFEESRKKSEALTLEISARTSERNQFLMKATEASDRLKEAQSLQEKELPKLQELLKKEEALRHHELEKEKLTQGLVSAQTGLQETQKILRDIDGRLQKGLEDITRLRETLGHPYDLLQTRTKDLLRVQELETQMASLMPLIATLTERLGEQEESGKAKSILKTEAEEKLKQSPADLTKILVEKEARKKNLQKKGELEKELEKNQLEKNKAQALRDELLIRLTQLRAEKSPLETTLALSELLGAVEICRTHPSVTEKEKCPVCESKIAAPRWEKLRAELKKSDLSLLRKKLETLNHEAYKTEAEDNALVKTLSLLQETEITLREERDQLAQDSGPVDITSIDAEIEKLRKEAWEYAHLQSEHQRIQQELQSIRQAYAKTKAELVDVQKKSGTFETEFEKLNAELKVRDFDLLRTDLRTFQELVNLDLLAGSLQNEKSVHEKEKVRLSQEQRRRTLELEKTSLLIQELAGTLSSELKDKKASDLITTLTQRVKTLQDDWVRKDADLRAHDLALRESQTRLHTQTDYARDLELQFLKGREEFITEARKPLPPFDERTTLLKETSEGLSLDLASELALYDSFSDLLESEKNRLKEIARQKASELSEVTARLTDWERRQDRVQLLELKKNEIGQKLSRLERLYDVLGKDELRTFVLSLVEENLIAHTNEELQRLCQGRYEILHQSRKKITPEFYVLDKFREGGVRKVSTLSGGETFMVSLAMALALAEMTRGQAEIDSLFIDEGFGTLDAHSLEDVLEMLGQIQTRGLMVGIITHVKPLMDALPLNLLVSKKPDGTSTFCLTHN